MFCPKCSAHIFERDLVRQNPRNLGGVTVEYDARCPNCRVELGHVLWGKLELRPEWKERENEINREQETVDVQPADETADTQETPAEPEQPAANAPPGKPDLPDFPAAKRCPHCGMELPPGF